MDFVQQDWSLRQKFQNDTNLTDATCREVQQTMETLPVVGCLKSTSTLSSSDTFAVMEDMCGRRIAMALFAFWLEIKKRRNPDFFVFYKSVSYLLGFAYVVCSE